jgi:hypothetical protein
VATTSIDVFTPKVTAPVSGTVGGSFVISGTGFPAQDLLNVRLIQGKVTNPVTPNTVYCLNTVTSGNGSLLSTPCTVPSSLHAGQWELEVIDNSEAVVAPLLTFTITASISFVSAAPYPASVAAVSAGQPLGIVGTGFGGNIATVTIGSATVAPSNVTVTNGNWNATITVPSTLGAGNYTVTVTDHASQVATANIQVLKPTISLGGGGKGAADQFAQPTGGGWLPNDSLTVVLETGGTLLSPTTSATVCYGVVTDSSGNIPPTACMLPTGLPAGSYTLLASDANDAVVATGTFKLTPSIILSGASGARGTSMTVYGYGFGNSVTVSSLKVGTTTVPFSTSTGTNGSFPTTGFTVPSITPGIYTVTITDSASNVATATLQIT